jgi:hypothetical protein
MGVFWGTWFSLSRTMDQLSAETFVAVGHQMIQNLGVPMAILLPLALLSALATLALLWPQRRTAAFWSIAAVVAVTISGTVAARPDGPPSNEVGARDRAATSSSSPTATP